MYGATRTTVSSSTPSPSVWRTSYNMRGFSNKGAMLTLLWNFSAFLLIGYTIRESEIDIRIVFAVSTIVYPLAGWLADVYFGRYKVIRCSMWIVWTALAAYNILLVVQFFQAKSEKHIIIRIKSTVAAVGLIALSGFQANSIQFGIDQFIDASSSDISSYISWYTWSYFFGTCLVVLSQTCFCGKMASQIAFLLFPLFFTLSLVSDILLNKWLIKEPVTHNPLKLILQVLRYAMKNKYPRLRSAFTYWDDKPYSRIDLAKTKFGGPFSTEQVEDVKTFFRILVITAVSSLFMGLVLVLDSTFRKLMFHYLDNNYVHVCADSTGDYMSNCYERLSVTYLSFFIVVIFVPFFEFVLYPLLWKCAPFAKLGIMHKFLLGMFLHLLCESYLLVIEVVATTRTPLAQNITCFFLANYTDLLEHKVLHMDYKWLIPSRLFSGISSYLLLTSAIEFVCAQAPYSMKGLMAGFIYGMSGISILLSFSVVIVIRKLVEHSYIQAVAYTCGVWYYLSTLVFIIILICIGMIVKKWYSPRRRDENVHNEQIFAVNYFDQYNSGT